MNRGLVAAPEGYKNFPRASGDEPRVPWASKSIYGFSPREWG